MNRPTKTLAAIAATLALSCGGGNSNSKLTSTPQKNPPAIFANLVAATDDGKHVVVEDEREKTKGDFIGITPSARTDRLLEKAPPAGGSTWVRAVVGKNVVFSKDLQQQRDLLVADIETGQVKFRTDTPSNTPATDKWMTSKAGNDGILFTEYAPTNGSQKFKIGDLSTGTSRPLSLPQPNAYIPHIDEDEEVLFVGYGSGKQALHRLKTGTGALSQVFDLNQDPNSAGYFTGPISTEMFAYPTQFGELTFRTPTGIVATYTPSLTTGYSHWIRETSPRNLQAIVDRNDNATGTKELLHVNLRFGQAQEQKIDLSQTGIKAEDISNVVIGADKVLLEANDRTSGRNTIRFYDWRQNTVSDLLSRFGTVTDASATNQNGKSLIRLQLNTGEKLVHFDGFGVNDPFGTYDSIRSGMRTQDQSKFLVEGTRNGQNGQQFRDLYHFDLDTGNATPLHSLVRGYFASSAISDDGTKAAFSTTDWASGENKLYLADMTARGTVTQIKQSRVPFYVRAFTKDGKRLMFEGSSGPKIIESYELATGNSDLVCPTD